MAEIFAFAPRKPRIDVSGPAGLKVMRDKKNLLAVHWIYKGMVAWRVLIYNSKQQRPVGPSIEITHLS